MQIGKYAVRGELGRGGMAVVYRAFDTQLEREVALKVIGTEFANRPDFVHRFEREAKTIARLDHPNIIPLYDYGRDGDTVYFVTRLLSGGSLQDRLGQPLSPADTANIVAQIADALDYAHAQGVVHRDVKPSNILFDSHGRAILTDFGIVKLVDSATAKTADVLGTPVYMSPEQVRSEELDGRSDQYSLAVVLYEMLTGRRLFDGQLLQVVYAHLNTPPPDPRALNPQITQPVVNILNTALAKSPTQRYPSLTAFARALGASVTTNDATVLVPKPDPIKAAAPTRQVERPNTQPPVYVQLSQTPQPQLPPSRPARRVPVWPFAAIGFVLIVALALVFLLPPLLRGSTTQATPTNPVAVVGSPSVAADTPAPTDTDVPTSAATVDSIATVTPAQSAGAFTPTVYTPSVTTPTVYTPGASANIAATLLQTMDKHTDDVHSVAWSSTGEIILTASSDKTIRVWNSDGSERGTLTGTKAAVNSLAWSPNGDTLAAASADGTIGLWGADGTLLTTFKGHSDSVENVVWSPDSTKFVSVSRDKTARVWGSNGSSTGGALGSHTDVVSSAAWSPDGKTIATGSFDKTVQLVAYGAGGAIKRLTDNTDQVWSLAWSPDGKILASGARDGKVLLWSADGKLQATLTGHTGGVPRLDWSPDGKILASASLDNTVRLWSADGKLIATLKGHKAAVNRVAWSPKGGLLASGSSDNTILLWRRDGSLAATLEGHEGAVTSLAWSPDGMQLVSGSTDNTAKLWQIDGQ